MGLSISDLAGCRSAISSMLPDTVTLYASDASTQVWQGPGRVDNDRSLTSMRNASDFTALVTPYGAPVAPGQVVTHLQGTTLLWYVVAKVSVDTAYTLEEQAMLLALPYALSVTRTVLATGGKKNGYGERRTPADQTVTTRTIRAGISNDNRPLAVADVGNMPKSVSTLYCPMGSDVQLADTIALPDGRAVTVQQRNLLDANGISYAYQLLADQV